MASARLAVKRARLAVTDEKEALEQLAKVYTQCSAEDCANALKQAQGSVAFAGNLLLEEQERKAAEEQKAKAAEREVGAGEQPQRTPSDAEPGARYRLHEQHLPLQAQGEVIRTEAGSILFRICAGSRWAMTQDARLDRKVVAYRNHYLEMRPPVLRTEGGYHTLLSDVDCPTKAFAAKVILGKNPRTSVWELGEAELASPVLPLPPMLSLNDGDDAPEYSAESPENPVGPHSPGPGGGGDSVAVEATAQVELFFFAQHLGTMSVRAPDEEGQLVDLVASMRTQPKLVITYLQSPDNKAPSALPPVRMEKLLKTELSQGEETPAVLRLMREKSVIALVKFGQTRLTLLCDQPDSMSMYFSVEPVSSVWIKPICMFDLDQTLVSDHDIIHQYVQNNVPLITENVIFVQYQWAQRGGVTWRTEHLYKSPLLMEVVRELPVSSAWIKPICMFDLDQTLVSDHGIIHQYVQNNVPLITENVLFVQYQWAQPGGVTWRTEHLYKSPLLMEVVRELAPYFDLKVNTLSHVDRAAAVLHSLDPRREHFCSERNLSACWDSEQSVRIVERPQETDLFPDWQRQLVSKLQRKVDGALYNPIIISGEVAPKLTGNAGHQQDARYKCLHPPRRVVNHTRDVQDYYFRKPLVVGGKHTSRTVVIDDQPDIWRYDRRNVIGIPSFAPTSTVQGANHEYTRDGVLNVIRRVHDRLAHLWCSEWLHPSVS
eukprot:CAMPEP_0113243150 /NCGR_PEP_ID=MMETSP0008_2-20120614/7712_1 /TAXON_ID=97485 /ORGANISM="Prymnesium parvum" /LENGTH=714 /DNA_ID=CAMNT_0000090677 /DNA_START=3 /DNA_END=2147 /DNA_ORIENTATION=+ /assembly_acc=CAM_ASM_000153